MNDPIEKPDAQTEPTLPAGSSAEASAHRPTLWQALGSLLQTIVAALFVVTFVVQPLLIPSESMEHTLLVGDFLLFDKQIYATPGPIGRWLLPYRDPARGDIAIFRHPYPPMLIKRVIGLPGDRLRIAGGTVFLNGAALRDSHAFFDAAPPPAGRGNFPRRTYPGPQVDPEWWRQMQMLTDNGELTVPAGEYFVLGDNRNHSLDSRYWGFVPRAAFVGRPLAIYFSLNLPSPDNAGQSPQASAQRAADDRLGHERPLTARIEDFARWRRIFRVVH